MPTDPAQFSIPTDPDVFYTREDHDRLISSLRPLVNLLHGERDCDMDDGEVDPDIRLHEATDHVALMIRGIHRLIADSFLRIEDPILSNLVS